MPRARRKPSLPGQLKAREIVGNKLADEVERFAADVSAAAEAAKVRSAKAKPRPKRAAHDRDIGAAHGDLKRAAKRVEQAERKRARLASSNATSQQITLADAEIREARGALERRQQAKAEITARAKGARSDTLALMAARGDRITLEHLHIADGFRAFAGGWSRFRSGHGLVSEAELAAKRAEAFKACRSCTNISACTAEHACRGTSGVVAFSRSLDRWRIARRTHDRNGRKLAPPPMFDPKPVKRVRQVSDGGLAEMVYWSTKRRRVIMRFDEAAIAGAVSEWPGRVGTEATARAAGEMASVGAMEVIVLNKAVDEVIAGWGMRKATRRALLSAAIVSGLLAVRGDVGC